MKTKNKKIIVNALIIKGNNLLAVKRKKRAFIGMYGLPGGHVEDGELMSQALKREVKEETGFLVELIRKESVMSSPLKKNSIDLLVDVYLCNILGGRKINSSDEISEVKWISFDGFINNLDDNDYPREEVERFQKLLENYEI